MADLLKEHKDALIRAAESAVDRVLASRGLQARPRLTAAGDRLGAAANAEPFETFVTGYDGSETTMPFMLDVSVLDGDDLLV
jgi:hypothetical protein